MYLLSFLDVLAALYLAKIIICNVCQVGLCLVILGHQGVQLVGVVHHIHTGHMTVTIHIPHLRFHQGLRPRKSGDCQA